MPVLNLVVAVLRGSIGRVIAVLRDRLLLLSLLVERFVLTLVNEDYYYYYGQRTKRRRNIAENFNRLSRVHERYRQTDDRRQTDSRTTT